MKKDIVTVDKGIVRITTADERWYAKPTFDARTGLPRAFEYVPSITWIARYYPKGIAYHKWLAGIGWNEAEAVRQAAAEKGSRVHRGISRLLAGETVAFDATFTHPETQAREELTPEEYGAILAFADWWGTLIAPKMLLHEQVVWGDGYAGTLDLLVEFGGKRWLIDFKTGQSIWPEHRIQVTAYREALDGGLDGTQLGILQLGYKLNKRRWKLTEIEPCPKLFAAARAIWEYETEGQKPLQLEYPLSVSLVDQKPELVTAAAAGASTSEVQK